jgi:hypothetical protein
MQSTEVQTTTSVIPENASLFEPLLKHVPSLTDLADIATVASFVVGGVAVVIALLTYTASSRAQRLSHLHKLFGDYLKMRIDVNVALASTVTNADEIHSELVSNKLYTLEEMWLWLKQEYPDLHTKLSRHVQKNPGEELKLSGPLKKLTVFNGWLGTISSHLIREDSLNGTTSNELKLTKDNLNYYKKAYTSDFFDFCKFIWGVKAEVRPPSEGTLVGAGGEAVIDQAAQQATAQQATA